MVTPEARGTTDSPPVAAPAPAAESEIAHEALAALASRRTSLPGSGSASGTGPVAPRTSHSPRDSADTIHASGLSPPPPPRAQQGQPGQPAQLEQRSTESPPTQTHPSPAASPPPKVRRPLPSGAPADPAASASFAGFRRRAPSTSYTTGAPSAQDGTSAADRDARDSSAGTVNSASSHRSITNGDRPAMDSKGHFPARAYEDEIVVDTQSNGQHSGAVRMPTLQQDYEDVPMDDARDQTPDSYTKRKRSPITDEAADDSRDRSPPQHDAVQNDAWRRAAQSSAAQGAVGEGQPSNGKFIPLGYWRDSTVPDEAGRHVVAGSIDTQKRLRVRIHQSTRAGEPISLDYPLPPGPGGSWVTFERVVFEKHLVGLDHNQVKEYVRIRSEARYPETREEAAAAEKAAVKEAIRRASMNPYPDTLAPPQIAYGADLPDYVINESRPDKKRRMNSHYGVALPSTDPGPNAYDAPLPSNGHTPQMGAAQVVSAIQRSAIDLLPGTRPTKILLGYWRGSSEERDEDKHAVFGILGSNDMFRVKLARQTRDGRTLLGNFPQGAGALWIHYDEVQFEPHIKDLSRPEVKEYVRVRQRQIDEGEMPEDRAANEARAVIDAQARVINAGGAAQSTLGTPGRLDTISFATAANLKRESGGIVDLAKQPGYAIEQNGMPISAYPDGAHDDRGRRDSLGSERRQSRRSTMDIREPLIQSPNDAGVGSASSLASRNGRHSLPSGPGLSAIRSIPDNADRVERTNSLARREISRMENIQQRNEQRATSNSYHQNGHNGASIVNVTNAVPSQHNGGYSGSMNGAGGSGSADEGVGTSSRQAFNENIGRLNKVWASQEASRLRNVPNDDTRIFNGIKYERKPTGPFKGKLVSPGAILSIDGEDYVEYRVLTKPTFF